MSLLDVSIELVAIHAGNLRSGDRIIRRASRPVVRCVGMVDRLDTVRVTFQGGRQERMDAHRPVVVERCVLAA